MSPIHEALLAPTPGFHSHVYGGRTSGLLASEVVRRLPTAGEALPAHLLAPLGRAFGQDLSSVRVHRDAFAADTARVFGARALSSGSHVLLGAAARASDQVLVHEVGHVVDQARTGRPVVQLDAIDQVQDLLSYGVLDWAVTDSEAMQALALLNALPDPALAAGLARLDRKYVDRLIDNLPDAARSGPAYQRVLQALGPARTLGAAVSDLNYGLFDWAVTDTDVTRVYNTFVNLAPAQQEPFLVGLQGAKRFGRLVANSSPGHLGLYLHPWLNTLTRGRLTPDQLTLVRTIVTETDDLPTLTLAASVRFDMVVGPTTLPRKTPVPWNAGQLRETYLTLEQLPDAHSARNASLVRLGQFNQPAAGGLITAGVYNESRRELAINAIPSGDLVGTIRHETGHSVDAQIGYSTSAEPAKPERGGWHTHASHNAAAADMIADAAAGVAALPAAQQTDVATDIATSMGARSTTGLIARVKARPWFAALPDPAKQVVTNDPTFTAVGVGLQTPWFLPNGGVQLGTHVHQESYTPTWVRYDAAARARLLTPYQFRDEGEWFAEAYDWYYTPDPRGKGMRLNDKDPNTKQWFDANVDPIGASR